MCEVPICLVIFISFSIVLHTFSKIHNFLIGYLILLKLVLIGLSDLSASIESNLFLEWTWPLSRIKSKVENRFYTCTLKHNIGNIIII